MNAMVPKIRGKPIPYTTFLGLFFLLLLLVQVIFLYYFYVIAPSEFSRYFLSVIVFFLIGLVFGIILLLYPYIKRTFDVHLVVLLSLTITIIFNFIFILLDITYPIIRVRTFSLYGLWHVISLGMIFVILSYVAEVEFEWGPEKKIKI